MNRLDSTCVRIKSGMQINPRLLPWILMLMRGITLAVKFIFTLFIAKYISLDVLGIYGLVVAAGILSPAVLGVGIMHSLSRAAVKQPLAQTKKDLFQYMGYLSSLYLVIALSTVAYFVVKGDWLLATLILVVIFLEHINGECYQLMINLSRPFLADTMHFTRSASWILVYMVVAALIPSFRNIYALLIAWLIGGAICTLVYAIVISRLPNMDSKENDSLWSWLKLNVKKSSWLYANGVATTGANYGDRYLIGALLNLELTGVYLFFWQIQSALSNLIYTGLIQIARPAFVKNFSQEKPDWMMVSHLIRNTAFMAIIFSLIALLGMAVVLPYLNMPLVSHYYSLFAFILVAFIFNVIAEAQVLVFYSKYKDHQVSFITFIVFACNFIGCLVTIPFFGLWGAAATGIFSALVRMGLQAYFISKYKSENLSGVRS